MGKKNAHLALRVRVRGQKQRIWIEACHEPFLKNGYPTKAYDARAQEAVPYHLGITDDPKHVTCRACIMLMPPEQAGRVAQALEREVLDGDHRLDTVVLNVTREEIFQIRVPKLEPSSERAELIATAFARGKGAVAARTKPRR